MTTATTLRGAPVFTATGVAGKALSGGVLGSLNALTGLITAPPASGYVSMGTSTFTMQGWIYLSANPSATKAAFGQDGVAWIGVTNAGRVTSIVRDITAGGNGTDVAMTSSASITLSAWHHVAFVCNGGAPSLYLDGARVAAPTVSYARTTSGFEGVALGGFGSSATSGFDFTGVVDEVAVSSIAEYTGTTYTVPTAPLGTNRAGQTHLYHLDADGTDAMDGAADASAPTISTFTATPGNAQNALAWSGSDNVGITRWVLTSGGVTLYDGTATSFTHTGLTNGTAYSYSLVAYDAAGNVSPASTASATPTAGASVTIAPNDPAITYSPYTWDVTASRALCITGGYFSTLVAAGTIVAGFDVSNVPSTAAQRSQIAYRVDGQAWTEAVPTASITIPIPSLTSPAAKHLVEVVVKATSETPDRWNSPYLTGVKFTGFTLGNGATVTKPTTRALNVLMLGDSITEGINTIGTSGDTTARSDTRLSWAFRVAAEIGANVGVVGFGRQGLVATGNGNVPVLGTTWKLLAAGLPRDLATTPPDAIGVNIGTNDANTSVSAAAFQAAATAFLNDMIANTPRSTRIVWFYPFGLKYATSVHQAAIAACADPRRVTFVDTTGWFATTDAFDGVHPAAYINLSKIAPLAAAAIRGALNAGRTFRKVGGVLEAVRASRY